MTWIDKIVAVIVIAALEAVTDVLLGIQWPASLWKHAVAKVLYLSFGLFLGTALLKQSK